MVKSIHTLTIRDYSLFDKTGDMKYLSIGRIRKKNLPEIETLLLDVAKCLGSDGGDVALNKEKHRIETLYHIQILITLYQAAYNLLINKTQIDVWRSMIGKNKGSDYTNLIEYVRKINEEAGIDINPDTWDDDMIALRDQIDLWTDRYNQNFPKQTEESGMTFMQIVLGVFAALKFPLNEDISMSDFFEMKNQAEEISRKMQLQADGR